MGYIVVRDTTTGPEFYVKAPSFVPIWSPRLENARVIETPAYACLVADRFDARVETIPSLFAALSESVEAARA